MTHYIEHLSFGRDYPGIVNPLDGTDVAAQQGKSLLREISFYVSLLVSVRREQEQSSQSFTRTLTALHKTWTPPGCALSGTAASIHVEQMCQRVLTL